MQIGQTIGAYQVIAKLGEGGMGEVYRAKDSKLKREVALKVLPADVANDRERMARFQREAEVLASLNHPHIAQIYGLEDNALVMELVEGEDLAERLKRGPIPLDEALPIAKQIAEALEAAHEQGIIHRDLKPANVKVRPDGTVKVLDFGLAKALDRLEGDGFSHRPADPADAKASALQTITSPAMTMRGMILGTAAYMAPEQAKGKAVDKRADIWAFGVVLYEMLTGTRAFAGEDITDTIVAVVSKEPDWSRLPPATPSTLRRLLRKCLAKDPRQRLRDIADARLELEEPANEPDAGGAPSPARSRMAVLTPWTVAAMLAVALAASWALRPVPAPAGSRYPIALPEGERIGPTSWAPMAVSPDGSRLVYVGESGRLRVRTRDQLESVEIPGTDGAYNPFFSPDGTRVGFMSGQAGNGQVRVVPLSGGPSSLVTATSVGGPGASWGADGYIYYDASGIGPLRRVRETGGESETISTLDAAGGELQHEWPDALPGGRGVLITINRGGPGVNISQTDDIGVIDLASGRHRVLLRGVLARYAASGHLVYVTADGVLMAAPFDEQRLEVTGSPVALIEGINLRLESGGIDVALSRSGTLWYATGTRQGQQQVQWATPTGQFSAVEDGWVGAFENLALSPDGSKLALRITDTSGEQIWVKDLARPNGSLSKITHERANGLPRWHPDGTRVSFRSALNDRSELRSVRVDGTGEQTVLASDLYITTGGWTPDGQWLVYSGQGSTSRVYREDIHGLGPGVATQPVPLVASSFNERGASVSPDGRWLLFEANPTGRYEAYVRPFPDTAASQLLVSTGGGSRPKWSRDGRAIFYAGGTNQLTRVAVVAGSTFAVGKPSTLFSLAGVLDWDVATDGRVILIRAAEADRGGQLVVVEDFLEELRRKVPR